MKNLYTCFRIISITMLCLVSLNTNVYSQTGSATFIIVRHAEKDLTQSTNDPDLSEEGQNRAVRLQQLLKNAGITEVYSTPYKRTTQTLEPTAKMLELDIKEYDPRDNSVFEAIVKNNEGAKVLVAGHSNTVPALLNFLTRTNQYQTMTDEEYGRLYIVTTHGTMTATVLELHY